MKKKLSGVLRVFIKLLTLIYRFLICPSIYDTRRSIVSFVRIVSFCY